MSTAIDYEVKRQLSDIQSKIASLDARARRDGRGIDRPGGLIVRAAVCAVLGHIQSRTDADIAAEIFPGDRALGNLITRAAVSPAHSSTATWAAELIQTVTIDLADRLIPESVLVRLARLGIPYNFSSGLIRIPTWSPTASGAFISEGAAIPVAQFVFGEKTLSGKKAAGIIALNDEMVLGSPADVELTLKTILSESLGMMIDNILLSSSAASTAAPAGLLAGVTPITASVLTPASAAMLGDVKALVGAIAPALKPVLIAGPVQAASLGVLAPNAGLNVLVSPTLTAGTVIAIDAAAFASALGVPAFRASQHVTLHMENTTPLPLSATGSPNVVAAPMRSAFQTDVTALRTILPCDWALRRTGAVAVVTGATW